MGQLQSVRLRSEEDLTEEAVAEFWVPLIKADSVIVSFKLTVGRVAIAANDMHSNEAIANLVPNTQSSPGPEYTYFFMKAFDYNKLGSTSSIATAVNSDSIRSIKMLFPLDTERRRIRSRCLPHASAHKAEHAGRTAPWHKLAISSSPSSCRAKFA